MAIVWEGHAVVEFKDLQDVVQKLQDIIKEYYVRKEDLDKMYTKMLLSKEQIEELVKEVTKEIIAKDIIPTDYVPREQYEKDIKELKDEIARLRSPFGEVPMDPEAKEIYEKLSNTGLSITLVEHYDPAIHNKPGIVYTDRRGNQWMNGQPISVTTEERVVYRSPVYKSIDSAKEEPKHELTEFTQADLDEYSSRAFGSSSIGSLFNPSNQQAASTPSVDECRSKWDDLHKTLQSQWDDLGGSNGNK